MIRALKSTNASLLKIKSEKDNDSIANQHNSGQKSQDQLQRISDKMILDKEIVEILDFNLVSKRRSLGVYLGQSQYKSDLEDRH
jgi:hypothetical protein